MADNLEIQLIAEKLNHALDLIRAQNEAVKVQQDHDREVIKLKFEAIEARIKSSSEKEADFETRLRDATTGVIQSRFFIGLAGGSVLLAIASLIKSFFF